MTQQKWEPGTVALVTGGGYSSRAMLRSDGVRFERWALASDSFIASEDALTVRPLLVLDPDNPDQMRELWEGWRDSHSPNGATAMTAAVRAMLPKRTPVKPAEPTGLGAVVEDVDGTLWTRVERGQVTDTRNPWYPATLAELQPLEYDEIAAVKVLSEGVTP